MTLFGLLLLWAFCFCGIVIAVLDIWRLLTEPWVIPQSNGVTKKKIYPAVAAQQEWKPNWDYDDSSKLKEELIHPEVPSKKVEPIPMINPATGLLMNGLVDGAGYAYGDGPKDESLWLDAYSTHDSFMDTHSMDMSSMDTFSTFDTSSTFDSFSSTDSFSSMHSYD